VTEEKSGKKRRAGSGENLIHSTAISAVGIYKKDKDGTLQRIWVNHPGGASVPPFVDTRLQEFFDSVKSKGENYKKNDNQNDNARGKKFSVTGATEAERGERGDKFYLRPEEYVTAEMALSDYYPDGVVKNIREAAEALNAGETTKKTPLKSEQQMTKELLERLGIKKGKQLSRKDGAEGKSYGGINLVRLKSRSNLRVAAHEAGHQLDERYKLTEKFGKTLEEMATKFEIPEWMRKVYKDGDKLKKEALAEFVNYYRSPLKTWIKTA
jgi:bifunctional DNA-binding transcriptional regulator/antitoxin component of YhaV-PrlF toxin-antitoxin module